MKKVIFVLIILTFSCEIVDAQWNSSHWRRMRNEVVIGAGGTNFLGDLGGSNTVGANTLRDFNYEATRYVFSIGYRYKITEELAVRGSLFYGRLYGSDEFTSEYHRSNRNLHFRSPIIELTGDIQFSLIKERYGHRYDLRRVKGRGNRPNLYLFTGISGIYFNPKAQHENGRWYALQPLGTEGQGVLPTRNPYSKISMAIPLGIGFNYMIQRNLGLGLEYGARFSFTDYIDDVSTSFVDPRVFGDNEIAKYFHDRSNPVWNGSNPGDQRGQDMNNDAYMFLSINLVYKLRDRGPGLPKF
jgi:hypothetical protein